MVKKPVTITIDLDQDKKLRLLQSKLISSTNSNWSYSKVLDIVLDEGLKSFKVEKLKKKN